MFDKILIANRGEIAVRVIKTCRRLGIPTVVAFSDADRGSLAVDLADEAIHIGPAPASESYLVIDKMLAAAKTTGATAVHPGFGFLSENAAFPQALQGAGLTWIGPNAGAIEAMGDKITSKKLAQDAGVSVVPGHMGLIEDADEAAQIAQSIGFPVMIKASAGGGGKGMRIAFSVEEAKEGFQSARNEARNSFGDERIFIEKFIEQPRHVEIQVLADKHGTTLHLAERECSIQRRNQKVLEEAPSPLLDDTTRAAMGAQAIALARAVNYDSAGTVEFIADANKNFYFLEMNTRLQVEHPVTELITGLDLVEQMIRVAAGEALSFGQEDVSLNGWALEARVYAEDPYRGFLPSIGRLTHYDPPREGTHDGVTVRVDTGVRAGDEISMFYDPMIAKLITHAPTRRQAVDAMAKALDRFDIEGIQHNTPFLAAVMGQERFQEGRLTTGYIKEEFPDGFSGAAIDLDDERMFAALTALAHRRVVSRAAGIAGAIAPSKDAARREWVAIVNGTHHALDVDVVRGGARVTFCDDRQIVIESDWRPGDRFMEVHVDGEPTAMRLAPNDEGYRVMRGGALAHVIVCRPDAARLHAILPEKETADSGKLIASPMPGLVVSVSVAEGQEVKAGEALMVVEAMKMENIIRAERDGTVKAIAVAAGASVAADDTLVEFA